MGVTIDKSESARKARGELERIGEDPEVVDWYCRVVDEFFSFGHSGSSFYETLRVLTELLHQRNLSPLTNDTNEWVDRTEISGFPVWQNNRNGEAFSQDGGATYWLLNESDTFPAIPNHTSRAAAQ
jgi:hypothetical protein